MRLADARFVLIDSETDRKEAKDAHLLEVAAMIVDFRGREIARFESLVAPTREIPYEASGINNITAEDLIDAPPVAQVEAELKAFVPPDAIVVAHNAAYDSVVLNRPLGDRRWLCSERLAHHLTPDASNFKLQTLRYKYGHRVIDMGGLAAHRAMADVLVLRAVFGTLLDRYIQRTFTIDDEVGELLDLATSHYIIKTMLFGGHIGTAVADLPEGYLRWGVGPKGLTNNPDLQYTFLHELDRRAGRMSFAQ